MKYYPKSKSRKFHMRLINPYVKPHCLTQNLKLSGKVHRIMFQQNMKKKEKNLLS